MLLLWDSDVERYDRGSYQNEDEPSGEKTMTEGKNEIYEVIIIIDKKLCIL